MHIRPYWLWHHISLWPDLLLVETAATLMLVGRFLRKLAFQESRETALQTVGQSLPCRGCLLVRLFGTSFLQTLACTPKCDFPEIHRKLPGAGDKVDDFFV